MAVLATKTERRCKLCTHPRRADIDALLERRSNRERDEAGSNINEEYVLKQLGDWGVHNPTPDNIKAHWKRHCEVITSKTLEATQKVALEKSRELIEGGKHVDVDENLRWLVTVGRAEIEERIVRGEKSGVTIDHVLKATAELTRRSHNAAQHDLLKELTGGIAQALTAPKKELPPIEVIEGVQAEYTVLEVEA